MHFIIMFIAAVNLLFLVKQLMLNCLIYTGNSQLITFSFKCVVLELLPLRGEKNSSHAHKMGHKEHRYLQSVHASEL